MREKMEEGTEGRFGKLVEKVAQEGPDFASVG